jgi:hypothetical protein
MIIDDFNLLGSPVAPHKTNPPLVVDANRVLTLTVTLEGLQPIAGWLPQIIQRAGAIEEQELATSLPLYGAKAWCIFVREQARRRCVPERTNHADNLFCLGE